MYSIHLFILIHVSDVAAAIDIVCHIFSHSIVGYFYICCIDPMDLSWGYAINKNRKLERGNASKRRRPFI